jgi:hypothetical protein
MPSFVYVLTNPAMPGIAKIGYSDQEDLNVRIGQLYTTGVPVPFEVAYAARVENARKVEDALHTAFGPQRVNPQREFFRIDPEQAIVILRLFAVEDTTVAAEVRPPEVAPEEVAARDRMRGRRPNLDFEQLGIPVGATLKYTKDNNATVTVTGSKKVRCGDDEMSLSAATQIVTGYEGAPAPALYWTYEGRLLREIYLEYHDEP